ncbi:hypothetical protein Tco_0794762 [Tanacetum coccineum]
MFQANTACGVPPPSAAYKLMAPPSEHQTHPLHLATNKNIRPPPPSPIASSNHRWSPPPSLPNCGASPPPGGGFEMDLFSFIRHSDPTKLLIGEKNVADEEAKLLMMTQGRVVPLVPPTSAASGGSGDSIDKMFDEGDNAGQENPTERSDDVSTEAIAQEVLEVAVEKTKKAKWKRKVIGDASGFDHPPKKLRDDYHAATPNVGGKSLAAIRGLMPEGSSVLSGVTEPLVVASVTPTPDCGYDGPTNFVSEHNLRTLPLGVRYVVSSDDSHHSSLRSKVNSFVRSPVANVPVMTIAVTTTVAADASAVPPPKVTVESTNLEIFGDSASADETNANVAGTSKLSEPATSSDSFYASQDLDYETLHNIYVPKWKMTNDSVLDDPYVCRDLTDRLAPHALFSQLPAMDYDQLYTEFNV